MFIPRFHCTGFSAEALSVMISEKNAEKLVSNIIKRVKFSKLDGVNLDCTQFWFSEDIYPLYVSFQQKLYYDLKALKKKLIVTFLPYSTNLNNIISRPKFEYLSRYFDYSVMMTYDYLNYHSIENVQNNVKLSPEFWIEETIDYYLDKRKLDKVEEILPKILIGFSFHGFIIDREDISKIKGNTLEGKKLINIVESHVIRDGKFNWNEEDKEYNTLIDNDQGRFYAVIPSKKSVTARVNYINAKKIGGMCIWEVGQGFESWLDEI